MATVKEKPAIVLVHGIWHSPMTYSKFTSALQIAGYEVHIPFLPSCTGARPPTTGLQEDTQLVRRFIEILADGGRSVVMVLHSYGGVVGSNAIEGLDFKTRATHGKPGGVVHLIGIAAHIHPIDSSIIDFVREMGNEDLIPVAFDIADDGSCMSGNPRALLLDGVDEEEIDGLLSTFSRSNYATMEAKVQFEGWRYVPTTYVHTRQDVVLPSHYQWHMVAKTEKAGVNAKILEVESGHLPFVTKTAEIVKIVIDIAETAA